MGSLKIPANLDETTQNFDRHLQDLGHSPLISYPQPSIRSPRRSSCADAALRAELGRVSQMTIEERVKAALMMRQRFDWLLLEAEKPIQLR